MRLFNGIKKPDAMVDEFNAARVRGALAPEEETLLPELLELHAGIDRGKTPWYGETAAPAR